jgi:hypothetical protein
MADYSDVYAYPYLVDYRNFTPKPSKTWEQLDLEEEANRETPAAKAEREERQAAEIEADEKRMADARAARTAMLVACNYKPEPSPEPEWVWAP